MSGAAEIGEVGVGVKRDAAGRRRGCRLAYRESRKALAGPAHRQASGRCKGSSSGPRETSRSRLRPEEGGRRPEVGLRSGDPRSRHETFSSFRGLFVFGFRVSSSPHLLTTVDLKFF